MMKKLLILILLAALLCPALAEDECQHMNLKEMAASSETVIEPRDSGHYACEIKRSICTDCYKKFEYRRYGDFQGHIFHMAESIHSHAEGRHLWVFLCADCKYITMVEEPCTGSENCMLYSAQAGEKPAVQLAESLAAWKEANPKNDIVKRWISQNQ